ncbi:MULTISPECIES: dynamin family protein [unclassified Microcoleus]|uniref:dynamin family protein n=1 Tax=unclassified Microcoleus TaxID=2642155 RepID=UPI001D85B1FD|nr:MULTISPECIES: dynamin family protein [unclassified Microcoleus]MCC3411095.1 dynamin family protein [Microcoleus sp. PH2017_02_FOX_O_A]MCC3516806.1 dynamin family protein [Microcoleus sp. PH2017_18_LLB_O_A]
MSSQEFQAAYTSIYSTGTFLLQYLKEFRDGLRTQGDENQGLQSIENEINKALNALQDQKYQVAVIAAMKAGKSTFLNSIIGADVLASETAACTICRTDVRHIKPGETPKLLEYREGQRKPVILVEGDAGEIQQKFLLRTREIREKGNPDRTIRFEIEHPIEAISELSSLTGFTLVDTPGPNEWESANFNINALKQTALEALRTCNAILFILNYASYKDNAVADLFKDVVENRKDFIAENTGKIYFILNKVDQKTERDKEIVDVIKDLERELVGFGFSNPVIYPASSRQGLLAKLIQQGKATHKEIKDFEDFFSAKYAERDEKGRRVIPLPDEIAPRALQDSGILNIQETVIQKITQNSGWNLLSEVVAEIDKAAKAIEDTLNTEIKGWEMGIESLKQKVEEYRKRSENARSRVELVKTAVELQKQTLIQGFSEGINRFADGAKDQIASEIDKIAESRSANSPKPKKTKFLSQQLPKVEKKGLGIVGEFGEALLGLIPVFGQGLGKAFKLSTSLWDKLSETVPDTFNGSVSQQDDKPEKFDPYIIRCQTQTEAQKILKTINDVCAPSIESWWIDTQDQLVREGTSIREQLAEKIQEDIQKISDELSNYLGDALQVRLNINPIQFPSFDFSGIDAGIQRQVEVFTRTEKITEVQKKSRTEKSNSLCKGDKTYTVDVPIEKIIEFQDQRTIYQVDLRQTVQQIKQKIDDNVSGSQLLLERVIEQQVSTDFKSAERQINDYINRFQNDFDRVLKERETKEAEAPEILARLECQKAKLIEYLSQLSTIRESLNSWKPVK